MICWFEAEASLVSRSSRKSQARADTRGLSCPPGRGVAWFAARCFQRFAARLVQSSAPAARPAPPYGAEAEAAACRVPISWAPQMAEIARASIQPLFPTLTRCHFSTTSTQLISLGYVAGIAEISHMPDAQQISRGCAETAACQSRNVFSAKLSFR